MEINWADVGIVVIILLSIVISVSRGFVREALSLATWVIALWLGIVFAPDVAQIFSGYIESETIRLALSYSILFIGALVIGAMVSIGIAQAVQKTGLSGTDRLFGMVFGIARGVIIVVLLILVLGLTNFSSKSWWSQSKLIPAFEPLSERVAAFLPEKTQDDMQEIVDDIPFDSE